MRAQVKWHQRLHGGSESMDTADCTWETAAGLIGGLNGRDRTDAFLGSMGDAGVNQQLSASGGKEGRYLVVVQEPGRYFYLARPLDPPEQGELVEVVIGGLSAFYPPALTHPLAAARCAAEHYFRTGRRARKLSWMRGDVADKLRRRREDQALRRKMSVSR